MNENGHNLRVRTEVERREITLEDLSCGQEVISALRKLISDGELYAPQALIWAARGGDRRGFLDRLVVIEEAIQQKVEQERVSVVAARELEVDLASEGHESAQPSVDENFG